MVLRPVADPVIPARAYASRATGSQERGAEPFSLDFHLALLVCRSSHPFQGKRDLVRERLQELALSFPKRRDPTA
jgi:hypothetical protein